MYWGLCNARNSQACHSVFISGDIIGQLWICSDWNWGQISCIKCKNMTCQYKLIKFIEILTTNQIHWSFDNQSNLLKFWQPIKFVEIFEGLNRYQQILRHFYLILTTHLEHLYMVQKITLSYEFKISAEISGEHEHWHKV